MFLSVLVILRDKEIIFSKLVDITDKDNLIESVSKIKVLDNRDVISIIVCTYDSEGESLGEIFQYTMGNNLILPTVKTIIEKISIMKEKACNVTSQMK